MSSILYREVTPSPRWLVAGIALMAVIPLWVVRDVVDDTSLSGAGPGPLVMVLPLLSGILLWLALVGSRLTVEVDAERVRFRFGPFGRTLRSNEIEVVAAERYSPWAFGGWGWRFGWFGGQGGAQAFTVPFLRSGVAVSSSRGRFYLSSRTPEQLAEAIRRVANPGTQ